MLIVLAVTITSVSSTKPLMLPMRNLIPPHIETNAAWNARSLSARTSFAEFAKALLIVSITSGMTSVDVTFIHHMPVCPQSCMASSRYLW